MSFAIYQRPAGVVFLDDDRDYLEMLAEVMPPEWYVRLFLRPVACIDALLQETARWEEDVWQQQEIINRWREGTPLIPQILQYWRDDGMKRFALSRVCVVDYSMPAMSGLRVLGELARWTGSRILLTGRADEQLAVSAFNRGLIEQFIPKQSPEIRLRLTEAIQGLLQQPDPRQEQIWRATLSREQHAVLCDSTLSAELHALAAKQGWVEHVVIGAPFGILALDRKGQVVWVQLEPGPRLAELAEMAASQGWNAAAVAEVAAGRQLIDLELQLDLGGEGKARQQNAAAIAGEASTVYLAAFAIPDAFAPGEALSHQRFVATHAERPVLD
ncbi:MAG: hypothetical protein JWQ72_3334 [Polaromonas sp.]|nr:hypothetical protein [Polaromonas sp.]